MNILRLIFFLIAPTVLVFAQNADFVILNKIFLEGNKRTHDKIILRELDIKSGDTIPASQKDTLLKTNRNRIYNTRLFNEVTLTLIPDSGHRQNLLIEMKERWYIFPFPILELADRSFNEWWYNQKRDLTRINYGVRFTDNNFRGRKEELGLVLQGGFTKKLELGYSIPYINKKQTWGLNIEAGYDQNRQVAFRTYENKQQFIRIDGIAREKYRIGFSLNYRKYFFGTHSFNLHYNFNQVADTITSLNPRFFSFHQRQQKYLQFNYYYTFDKRDVRAYAHKGYYFKFSFEQNGFTAWDDIRITVFDLTFAKYFSLGRNFFLASLSKGKTFLSNEIPYFNVRGLGYDQDYVRGYDLYVVDSKYFLLQRLTLRKKLFERDVYLDRIIPLSQFNKIPLSIYLNTYYDLGYGYTDTPFPGNEFLTNELLRGGGIGFDIVTYYDSVVRFEFSVNKMMERRIYIAFTRDI